VLRQVFEFLHLSGVLRRHIKSHKIKCAKPDESHRRR
jgi:hypothetical protein